MDSIFINMEIQVKDVILLEAYQALLMPQTSLMNTVIYAFRVSEKARNRFYNLK
jgi:hypothetical protein